MGRGEQPQHQEHADLAEPGQAVQHRQGGAAAAQGEVAEQEAGEVDGEDAAAPHRRGEGEDEQAAAHREQRIEPGGQAGRVDEPPQQPAPREAYAGAEAKLLDELQQQEAGVQPLLGAGQHLYQGDGEKDRHGIVAAGLYFQGGADPLVEAAPAEQGEDSRRIGGADDGPDQHPLHQVEVKQPGGGQTGQACGDGHPDGGERQGGPECDPKGGDPGAHAAIQQDDGERQVAHQVGDRVVGEVDAAGTILTGQHADGEEDDQDGDADPGRERT